MHLLKMEVYQMDCPDGSPRKHWWCYHHDGTSTLTTRWGGANKALQENAKLCSSFETFKLVKEKESNGYRHVGSYMVDDSGIKWDGPSLATTPKIDSAQTQPQQPVAVTTTKFSNILLHWTAANLPVDWQKVVQEVLKPVVEDCHIALKASTNELSIIADDVRIEVQVRNSRARGTIEKGKSAWLLSLCMVKLARHLQIAIVDDDSTAVDRRYLSSNLDTLGVSYEEFNDVAEKLGLVVSKSFVKANPVIANFF